MAVARSVRESFTYVTKADRLLPPEQRSQFLLRQLTALQASSIDTMAEFSLEGAKGTIPIGRQRWAALKIGLIGWSNFAQASGEQVEFKRDRGRFEVHGIAVTDPASDASLGWLDQELFEELADAVRAGAKLTDADVGN